MKLIERFLLWRQRRAVAKHKLWLRDHKITLPAPDRACARSGEDLPALLRRQAGDL
jgi:hypothetical protein